ncbi:MAG: hypothetical protein WC081_03485 [Candidatus Ratteibacteria bacterium]|jgi:hypothetical protein
MDKKLISIKKLLVNPENPRFDAVRNPTEAINLMMTKAGKTIFNLATDVAKHGLNPSKSLMVVEVRKNSFLPLEGNRRVVALKLLDNPELASSEKLIEAFKELKREYNSQIPVEVECTIFPDKESASHWVNLEHTGKNNGVGVLSWNSEQRQRFIALYAGKKGSYAIQLFDFADENNLDRSKVDSTTLDRLISTPLVRKQIGIHFPDRVLELIKSRAKVVGNLRKIFTTMSDPNFKVGDVYTASQRENWIEQIIGTSRNKQGKTGAFDKKERSDRKPIGLFRPSDVPYKLKNRQLQKLYDELKDPEILNFPNAAHDLLRSFLECSLVAYLKQVKKYSDALKVKKKNQNNLTLTDILDYLSNQNVSPIEDKSVRSIAKQLISDDRKSYSVERMNMVNHNENWFSEEDDVRNAWVKMEPLFKVILRPKKMKL